jgi:hypothetical protein
LNISAADLEQTIQVKKGNCICFASNLVHGRGASSIKSDQSTTSQLSDLSIHIDFTHEGLSKGSLRANGVTHIWPFLLDQGESDDCEAVYKYNGKSPEFKKAVEDATSSWVGMYGGGGGRPQICVYFSSSHGCSWLMWAVAVGRVHAHTHTHTHTQTHRATQTHTQTHIQTDTDTGRHRQTHAVQSPSIFAFQHHHRLHIILERRLVTSIVHHRPSSNITAIGRIEL